MQVKRNKSLQFIKILFDVVHDVVNTCKLVRTWRDPGSANRLNVIGVRRGPVTVETKKRRRYKVLLKL